jgi:FKBP-type peptidyl-prolyl cis-trans isomerase
MLSNVLGANAGSTIVQGVTIVDTQIGTGKVAVAGQKAIVHYVGKLKNGKIFDSSAKKPFSFMLGRGQVIRGWDIGVVGMKVGGKRQLTIPPEKAYGRQGAPPTIPGNATLIFDITLIDTK